MHLLALLCLLVPLHLLPHNTHLKLPRTGPNRGYFLHSQTHHQRGYYPGLSETGAHAELSLPQSPPAHNPLPPAPLPPLAPPTSLPPRAPPTPPSPLAPPRPLPRASLVGAPPGSRRPWCGRSSEWPPRPPSGLRRRFPENLCPSLGGFRLQTAHHSS